MGSTWRAPLVACVVSLAGGLGLAGQERSRLRASVGGSALPEGVRHEIIVEEQVDLPDASRITVGGRKGLEFADAVKVGDDVRVESWRPDSAADSIFTGDVVGSRPPVSLDRPTGRGVGCPGLPG